jgi:hypothetical protein
MVTKKSLQVLLTLVVGLMGRATVSWAQVPPGCLVRVILAKSVTVAAMVLALCLGPAGNAAAQSCVVATSGTGPPGQAYPIFDWRLIRDGELPQNYGWRLTEDALLVRVDDGRPLNLMANQMRITLVSLVPYWIGRPDGKEIGAWDNLYKSYTSYITTWGGNTSPVSMTITRRASCEGAPDTIVLRKAKFAGVLSDMYYVDLNNFWSMWGGKSITFTWLADDLASIAYPPPCASPCIPLGTVAPATPAARLVGDFNGDLKPDIALSSRPGWGSLPVAFSIFDPVWRLWQSLWPWWVPPPGFRVDNVTDLTTQPWSMRDFASWAAHPQAKKLVADFNHDGKDDVALTGVDGWNSIPVAFSNGDGSFRVTNEWVGVFAYWASRPGAKLVVGKFNGNDNAGIAVTGLSNLGYMPLAMSNGDGTFRYAEVAEANSGQFAFGHFVNWSAQPGVKVLVADFDHNGKDDIALTGSAAFDTVPVAFSDGYGRFDVTTSLVPDFPAWASQPGVKPLVGFFDNDSLPDIALYGGAGWTSMPVAFSRGDGSFLVANPQVGSGFSLSFPGASPQTAKPLVGDFDGDRRSDVALITGHPGWSNTLPVAYSEANQTFEVIFSNVTDFPGWGAQPWVQAVVGDFDHDGKSDIALVGGIGWRTLPVLFSDGRGSFRVTNDFVGDFGGWAAPY